MPEELTVAEVRRHAQATDFSASFSKKNGIVFSWVETRGRIEKGAGDSGKDLILMKKGGFPKILVRGEELTGGIVFSPSGNMFCYQTSASLMLGDTERLSTSTWSTLQPGESFCGLPVWIGEDKVLFGVRGGAPKRDRLFMTPAILSNTKERHGPLFVAEAGGTITSWDHSQKEDNSVVLIHRLANAMMAEVVLVSTVAGSQETTKRVLAVDCGVEYCKPMAAFLSNGSLLLRLNALFRDNKHLKGASFLKKLPRDNYNKMIHGLWLMQGTYESLIPVDVADGWAHGSYDVCSNSYGRLGAPEGFRLDSGRTRLLVTARRHTRSGKTQKCYADELCLVDFAKEEKTVLVSPDSSNYYGCIIPVAIGETQIIFHYRSPIESGDLYMADLPFWKIERLTETMPLSLKNKLKAPTEVMVKDTHALLFSPKEAGQTLQPLVWLHGGPMCQYSYDFNPLLNWLAECGYLVLAPNFSGSTGNGIEHMGKVLGIGCGEADLVDCLACAKWFHELKDERLDLSRGIAVGGHSWGGYLALMSMLESKANGEGYFSCGICAAGITDWFVQQRYTEVRYYDYALLGGWVYEKEIAERARALSPINRASYLRAPLLILHGDQDIDVPFQQIPPFVEEAKRSSHHNASVEYHAYPGEGHGMSGTAEVQADYLNRIKTFLRINLKPWDFTSNPHGNVTAY